MIDLYINAMLSFIYRDITQYYDMFSDEKHIKRELATAIIDLGRQTGKTSAAIKIADCVPETVLVTFKNDFVKELKSRNKNINVTTPIKLLKSIQRGDKFSVIIFDEHTYMDQSIVSDIITESGKYTKIIKLG